MTLALSDLACPWDSWASLSCVSDQRYQTSTDLVSKTRHRVPQTMWWPPQR